MKNIRLGKSSFMCSRIAYGCWRISGSFDSKEVTEATATKGGEAVLTAYEAGYTLFDLADIYTDGLGETIFGQVLAQIPGMRDKILIATKCGIRKKGDPFSDSPYRYDFSEEHIVWSCEQSLKRMNIESIDIYLLHRPDFLCDPEEVGAAFEKLHKAGKIREAGVSNFRPSQVAMLQKFCSLPIVANQVEISLAKLDTMSDGTLDQCLTDKISPLAWSPLDGGTLGTSGKTAKPTGRPVELKLIQALDAVAEGRGVSRTVVALAWLLKHPSNIVPILGSTNPENIKDAVHAADLDLTRDEWYRLLEAARGERLP